jgi:excisionase family DNA binding protein
MEQIFSNEIGLRTSSARKLPLRVNNVAQRLGIPQRTVRHWAKTGKLRAFKIDKKSWGFLPHDVDSWQRLNSAHM